MRVLCVNQRCPCYHSFSRAELDTLPPWDTFSGDHVDKIRRLLWAAENESREAEQ